ncbi:MAG: hypothetical protein WAQ98_11305 [Blastocatellia bacterium]
MVQLNTSNYTPTPITPITPITPMILNLKRSGFQPEPDWIRDRDELTDSYKRFYAHVVRRIGKRGFAFLSVGKLARDLRLCTRTISRHIKISREFQLMEITPTGRSLKFVIVWHPWMPIAQEEANQQELNLADKKSDQIRQFVQEVSPQNQSNQLDADDKKCLETISIEPNKEKSMHAGESSQHINDFTSDKTENITSTQNLQNERHNSIYTLEIILKFVLAYALTKLGTSDEIRDHLAIARRFLRTGEKDPWIAAFIENDYVLSPINPLKDQKDQITEQPLEQPKQSQPNSQSQNQPSKISPSQARNVKQQQQTIETEEVKGKYPYQVYLDFVNYELKQGKTIYSVKGLADWLYKNGSQDVQVGEFIELMRNTWTGKNQSRSDMGYAREEETNKKGEDSYFELDRTELEQMIEMERLATDGWNRLDDERKEEILSKATDVYKDKYHQLWTKDKLKFAPGLIQDHVLGLVKGIIGKMLYSKNVCDLGAFGESIWIALDDSERGEMIESQIADLFDLGINFYSLSQQQQQEKLLEIEKELFLELALYELADRI